MTRLAYIILFLFLCNCTTENHPNNFNLKMHGHINGKYPVTFQIASNNRKVSGFYYYDKFMRQISLSGYQIKDSLILEGRDNTGKLVDVFNAKLTDQNTLTGYWRKANSDKIATLELSAGTINKSSNNQIIFFLLLVGGAICGLSMYIIRRKRTHSSRIGIMAEESISPGFASEKKKGEDFENYITTLFPKRFYKLKEWRSDKIHLGISAEANRKPDLEYQRLNTTHLRSRFAVECKYRKSAMNNKFKLCKDYQLEKYKKHESTNNIPVFIALGVGGAPIKPDKLFIIPLKNLKDTEIHVNELQAFEVKIRPTLYYDPELLTLK